MDGRTSGLGPIARTRSLSLLLSQQRCTGLAPGPSSSYTSSLPILPPPPVEPMPQRKRPRNIIGPSSSSKGFRNCDDSDVKNVYCDIHKKQTVAHVLGIKERLTPIGNQSFLDVFEKYKGIIDPSDPDTHFTQDEHAFQTALSLKNQLNPDGRTLKNEALAKSFPEITDWGWLQMIGLIHDFGKIVSLDEFGGLEPWSVVGDTFPVGAPFSKANICYGDEFYTENLDYENQAYQRATRNKYGKYDRNIGFDNLHMSYGHDEYWYHCLRHSVFDLPEPAKEVALYLTRFHSFYPWHTPEDAQGYSELASEKDERLRCLLQLFQRSDLYSKTTNKVDDQTKSELLKSAQTYLPQGFALFKVKKPPEEHSVRV